MSDTTPPKLVTLHCFVAEKCCLTRIYASDESGCHLITGSVLAIDRDNTTTKIVSCYHQSAAKIMDSRNAISKSFDEETITRLLDGVSATKLELKRDVDGQHYVYAPAVPETVYVYAPALPETPEAPS